MSDTSVDLYGLLSLMLLRLMYIMHGSSDNEATIRGHERGQFR